MSTDFDRDLQRACEPFDQDHERLRAELMASLPVHASEGPSPTDRAHRRHRTGHTTMTRRILRIGIPAAVAAAVILAVGLWPQDVSENGTVQPGRGYALADIPRLLDSAKVLHLREWYYIPGMLDGPPDLKRRKVEAEYWLDVANGRWRLWFTDLGLSGSAEPTDKQREMTYRYLQRVSDGEYMMELWHDAPIFEDDPTVEKLGEYTLLTPYMRHLEVLFYYPWVTACTDRFRDATALGQYVKVGEEELHGDMFELWEHEQQVPRWDETTKKRIWASDRWGKTRVWLSPATGDVGRLETWYKGPATDGTWMLGEVTDIVERDVEPPPGIFDTTPPAGYVMRSTKETAPLRSLSTECHTLGFGDLELRLHMHLSLSDGSILFGWSSRDASVPEDQAALFENLVPGGPLPPLPIEIQAIVPENEDCDLHYTGRHLAWTQKDGRCYEWALYVPQYALPAPQDRCAKWWQFHYVVNSDRVSDDEREPLGTPAGDARIYRVNSPADFDRLVVGAVADLSDGGVIPEHVTYEYVTQLCEEIRASLNKP